MNRQKTEKRYLLAIKALLKFVFAIVVVAVPLFSSAGTWNYTEAWIFITLLFVPMFILGIVMLLLFPELLVSRLTIKENSKVQKIVVALSGAISLMVFVVAGFDYRYSLTSISVNLEMIASVIFLLSYILYAETVRENQWLSRTIKVFEEQKVISDGLYRVVRHPMYFSTLLMFLSIPLILASWLSFTISLLYIPILVVRIIYEERFLRQNLNGYTQYCEQVRWRIIPFVW